MTHDQTGMFGASGTGDTSGYGGLVRTAASTGSTERPYGGYFDDVADDLERAYPDFADAITRVVVDRGELTLHVKKSRLVEVAFILRDKLKFEMCMGVSGVHYPDRTGAELVALYPLLSLTKNQRVRLEVATADLDPHIPSVVEVWAGNNWHERET
ncbi:MAG: NADH-quinone oxidoreductase subunit C, partial [Actinobacteria bacterium]|nr:NADH-quinone oxidoreductase subunit C [Actinomycetota bacterium]